MEEGSPLVQLAPPLTDVAWSSAVVAQSLEALLVCLRAGQAAFLRPIHAPSLRLGWGPGSEPGAVIVAAAARYRLTPEVVHSTSWRYENDRLVLTYLAVVTAPSDLSRYLIEEPIDRADLARGDRLAPPTDIGVGQVVEHAFRHLAWLVADDETIAQALPAWIDYLSAYEAEPFRAFGTPPG